MRHQDCWNSLTKPATERKISWREFILTRTEVLAAVDFFTAKVWTSAGLITYYVSVRGKFASPA